MNCPQCNEKATRKGGGVTVNAGRICYYHCPDCGITFAVTGQVVRILTDEPDLPFKSRREAFRTVRQAVRDDREWFEAVTDETEALARLVIRNYLKGAKRQGVML